ncbi:MAG TPA: hypothetical protein PKD85_05330, partial [Saprospiraceae bacterium]|nr:hypothetical protein [Saprospiraceae bacterium]
MISVQEALNILNANLPKASTIDLPLDKALHYYLANDTYAPIHMPPFRQAIMDGYAVKIHDALTYDVVDTIKAGDAPLIALKPGEAVKIFTGAP